MKLSVIVPVYNTQKFLNKCLDSIVNQSINDYEVILVNDCSTDQSSEIINDYASKYVNVVVINHEENKGLYQARLSGIKIAKGEFVGFVDSDDTVSVDWFRLLIKKAEEEDADMIVGNTVNVFEKGDTSYYSVYRSLTVSRPALEKEEIFDTFIAQQGECFLWHTLWNKIYKKALFKKALPDLEKLSGHILMTEDMAFSFILFYYANKLAFSNTDCYLYYRHGEASTSLTLPKKKFEKNLLDLGRVFKFIDAFVQEHSPEKIEGFCAFKDKYFRMWSSNLIATPYADDEEMKIILLEGFEKEKLEKTLPHEFYFYELTSPWDGRLENIKKLILDSHYKIISFDIFDTLILRPFIDPKDLFYFVAYNANSILKLPEPTEFYAMRIHAEDYCRQIIGLRSLNWQDVTLEEIYTVFADIYGYSEAEAQRIRKIEEELELKFCYARQTAKELFELAQYAGKRIIITSDIYLDRFLIESILDKTGYKGYEKLYLSSECRLLKATGNLYHFIVNSLACQPTDILHIGDNWNADIVMAKAQGLNAIFLPKTVETFENTISDISIGNCSYPMRKTTDNIIDYRKPLDQLPIRCLYAIAANRMFDNPYKNFQQKSDYNGDPYFIGSYCLGMHLFGVAKWIYDNTADNTKIQFLARDGKIVKDIFDLIVKADNSKKISGYICATRKALFPYLIESSKDLFNVINLIDVTKHTYENIMKLLSPVLKNMTPEIAEQYKKSGVMLDQKVESKERYLRFVKVLSELSFDEEKAKSNRAFLEDRFSKEFEDSSACFDIGYSGRLQKIINLLSNKNMTAFYIHDNGYESRNLAAKEGFNIRSFYDFSPCITAIIREYLISGVEPSCIGYDFGKPGLHPIYDTRMDKYSGLYAINELHRGAMDFCREAINKFSEHLGIFKMRAIEVSAPFEYYLSHAKEFDRYIWSNSSIEDEMYSGYSNSNLFDVWTWHLNNLDNYSCVSSAKTEKPKETIIEKSPFEGKSLFQRAMYYFLCDNKIFWKKAKGWLKRKINK